MLVRCQLCNTPEFELTIRDDEVIIITKRKHHGEWHKSLIRIEDLIAKLREESPDDRDEKALRALELWELWFVADGNSLYASECGGDLHCFFCGGFAVSPNEQDHGADCIYVKAKALVGKESHGDRR